VNDELRQTTMMQKILLFFTLWTVSSFIVAILMGRQLARQLAADSMPIVNYQAAAPVVRVRTGQMPNMDTLDHPLKARAN
jgi:hypothetical protein